MVSNSITLNLLVQRKQSDEIPHGLYCYTMKSIQKNPWRIIVENCPYWSYRGRDEGWCAVMETEIEDQCKLCDINMGLEEFDKD